MAADAKGHPLAWAFMIAAVILALGFAAARNAERAKQPHPVPSVSAEVTK